MLHCILIDWEQFVTIQTSRWMDMLTNWTIHSSPEKVNVISITHIIINLKRFHNLKH